VTRISVFILVKYLVRGIFMGKDKKETTKKKAKEEKVVKKGKASVSEKSKKVAKKDKKKETKAKKVGFFKSIINFFKGVKSEMSKVTWPNKKDMVKYTIASLVFIIFFALFFYGIEVLMAWLKSIIVVI
jgi:preprotein translocase subunit SecE